jgi:alpha-galactosidase
MTRHFSRREHLLKPTVLPTAMLFVLLMPRFCMACPTSSEPASVVVVTVKPGGPVVIRTPTAEFEVLPSGYLRAFLVKDGRHLTLDEPQTGPAASSDYLVSGGKEIRDFVLDFHHVKVSEARGKLGSRGKRVELTARTSGRSGPLIEKTLAVEVYDDFPNLALTSMAFKNLGPTGLKLDQVVTARRRLNASLADPQAPPFRLWSFHGSSSEWGTDDVVLISKGFSRPNALGAATARGLGGGIPIVAFWTASVGEAFGHIETVPLVLSLPVEVEKDDRVAASVLEQPATVLQPGEVFSSPRSFLAVYSGDFYEPLRLWSRVLQREGWTLPKPSGEAYNASWCGWGYEFDVTPAQMLGTIPKLKEFDIHWATLDDRWFGTYGDWEPRPDTFPGDSIRQMVDEFHRQGIRVQIWWRALAAEDGQGRYDKFQHKLSKVVEQHPDWLILDKDGKHAHMSRSLAVLCPALPEVQEYHRRLAEKFIRDWGFDGHKLDNAFTARPCYNPKHHHKSPQDSIAAVGKVYKAIFETTRALKPDSVTQVCSCGTPPNFAWLPFLDQAVTADPVGPRQVRLRIKMFKALLGPQSAVYGDHVELTEIKYEGEREIDLGKDFASTVGPGGVVGTKFVWPDPGRFPEVVLTPEKESHWKKWLGIYNAKMLARGTFLNLYVTGYDLPEGYAIEKDGKMYYAFFTPAPSEVWKGEIELRGLGTGRYRVFDYVNGRELGTVDGQNPKLATEFTEHLLLEVSKL